MYSSLVNAQKSCVLWAGTRSYQWKSISKKKSKEIEKKKQKKKNSVSFQTFSFFLFLLSIFSIHPPYLCVTMYLPI